MFDVSLVHAAKKHIYLNQRIFHCLANRLSEKALDTRMLLVLVLTGESVLSELSGGGSVDRLRAFQQPVKSPSASSVF